ncbi:hypothetical protein [uncultured Thiohalocapsa sp.]|uniref:hypothetical protein n=1 Tax=uncultured Thiohalocapsa sp. TaxID=768990 RepID=UPI0025D98C93|nr:hypothetical protein [uncultured Thiohalocapsa sp.]
MDTQAYLVRQSRSVDPIEAAVADNCRFDERASAARWQQFLEILEQVLEDPEDLVPGDWAEANTKHLDQYVAGPKVSVPDAFLAINRDAWLTGIGNNPNQSLVRIESLTRALNNAQLSLEALRDILTRADSGRDSDAQKAADSFFSSWSSARDGRPAFAAFYDEVKEEADADDWPHALRDRLGLGHYGTDGGAPMPVALMRYRLAEVISAQADAKLPIAAALPTVLDGGMHEFFFPVPREETYGATLHLLPEQADTLTCEIIHCRIEYTRPHLWKLGWIHQPHACKDAQLQDARDLHLIALQDASGRDDFGEPMQGRT